MTAHNCNLSSKQVDGFSSPLPVVVMHGLHRYTCRQNTHSHWMGVGVDGRTDGWMDIEGWIDGWTDGRTDGQMIGRILKGEMSRIS